MMKNSTNPVASQQNAGSGKKQYIEILRAIATVAVVFLHINMTQVANYSATEIGVLNYTIFNDLYILVKWAVPCFIMISGTLLLNPARKVDCRKIGQYILRMIYVLFTFGVVYAMMELVFSERRLSVDLLFRSVLNMLQGKSWSHMWYVYMLIGLYLLTIPLRYMIEKLTQKELETGIIILVAGSFLIPSINVVLGLTLENYMLLSEYVVWYLLGYYLSVTERNLVKYAIPCAVVSAIIMIVTESVSLHTSSESFALNHQRCNIFTLIFGASVYLIARKYCPNSKNRLSRAISLICTNSFAIYLVHPFYINLIYKVLGVTPLSMPIVLGIVVLTIVVFALSLGTAMLLKRIPLIKQIL